MHNPANCWNMLSSANATRLCVRVLLVIALGGVVASCSSVGDTTRTVVRNLNPVNWFGDEDNDKHKQKKPLAAGKPSATQKGFPKLGSVPGRPKRPSSEEQTKEIAEGLAADTANARYSNQQLRQSTAVFGGQPRPPSTITPSRPVSPPATLRRQASPSMARALPPTITRPVARPTARTVAPPPAIRPPAIRPPAVPNPAGRTPAVRAPSLRAPSVRAPVVRPPAPVANQGIVSPPTVVRTTTVARPPALMRPPAALHAPTVAPAPPVARPSAAVRAPTPPPPPVRVARAVRRPVVTRPAVPATRPVAAPVARRQFATPIGQPNQSPKPPPVATPIGGSLNERTVALRPPNPANVSRSMSAPGAPVSQRSQGVQKSLRVGTIYFGDGSAQLSTQDRSILQAVTDVFGQMGGRVRVIGHSSMGARTFNSAQREAVNFKMSLKRANAVANELIRQGIPPENVEVVAEGDRTPVYAETSQTGAAYNRRTEIFIDYLERS